MKDYNNPEQVKSAWNKPVLTVLVRNNPEEEVLTACKMVRSSVGPGSEFGVCYRDCEGKCFDIATS